MSKIPLSLFLLPIHFFLALRAVFIGNASKNTSLNDKRMNQNTAFVTFLFINFESFALFSFLSLVTDFLFSILSAGTISRTFLLNTEYQVWLLGFQLLLVVVISLRFFLRERNRNLLALLLSELILLFLFSIVYVVTQICFPDIQ
jgi:hypothetical protein